MESHMGLEQQMFVDRTIYLEQTNPLRALSDITQVKAKNVFN